MKVGILTWYIGYNLGAALQALALQRKVQEILDVRHDNSICEVVHYQTTDQNKGYLLSRQIRWGISKDIRKSLINLRMIPVMRRKKKAVDCFLEEYIPQSPGYTQENIVEANKRYDVFLCGSDQIWNPNWLDKNYLLDFVGSGKKRISYASSVGVDEIPIEISDVYRDNLGKFERLSVRENAGRRAIEKIGAGGAKVVCDPVLLLDKKAWNDELGLSNQPKEPYVFCYFIGTDNKKKQQILDYCEKKKFRVHYLRYVNGFSVFDSRIRKNKRLKILKVLSPRQFVEEIAGASLIFTDSFHGMCFSLIEHTPFYIADRSDMGTSINMSSRIDELLARLGLTSRKKDLSEILDDEKKMEIDWTMADNKLKEYRGQSMDFLKSALKGKD